ncbi:MAG TPA: TIGR03619 family F420-dependent LLM class oxidoreductase [Solirubrobacteraceae bacterium]|jgi:probable F420-dependent oxidoreductase|nr:TIGR03619 family F420-dependent LLM class oxidoreductase [Solirubrobacteraceae bacterium]
MKFGVALPTCTAGMLYPVPFASAQDIVRVAVEAEQLGYYEVAGNDHFTTQRYVRETFADPPDFFDPLITYAYCAAKTSVIRLLTGILVLPMRHPVVLAKQLATLDRFSDGRLLVGVGIGAYREEFVNAFPDLASTPRGDLTREGILALRSLLEERRASFDGEHIRFNDLEMYPKPVQTPLPIYSSGNADGSIKRAAELCEGWLPAALSPEGVAAGKEKLETWARAAGRDPSEIVIALQLIVCIGESAEEARDIFERSQVYHHLVSLQQSTLKGMNVDEYVTTNLLGTPDDISRQIEQLEALGVSHLCGLIFVGNTVDEMLDQIRMFARDVIPNFPDRISTSNEAQ